MPGYAERIVKADRATWSFYLHVEADDPTKAGEKLNADVESVRKWIVSKGIPGTDMRVQTTGFDHSYRPYPDSRQTSVTAQIDIQTSAVDAVRKANAEIATLAIEDLRIQSMQAYMTYTGIESLRAELEQKAIEDARARATRLAEGMHRSVGEPRSIDITELAIMDASVPTGAYGGYGGAAAPSENQKVIARASTKWNLH